MKALGGLDNDYTITESGELGSWGSALYSLGSTVHMEARLWQEDGRISIRVPN